MLAPPPPDMQRPPPCRGDGLGSVVNSHADATVCKKPLQSRQGTCNGCGKNFIALRIDARFCCNACRQRAHRRRHSRNGVQTPSATSGARWITQAAWRGGYRNAQRWTEAQRAAMGAHKLFLVADSLELLTATGHVGPHEHAQLDAIAAAIGAGIEPSLELRALLDGLARRVRDLRFRRLEADQ